MMGQVMNIEVHVAAMHQKDLSLYTRMNVCTDMIIANQCDTNRYDEEERDNCLVRMISTNTRGVGKNRNFALGYSNSDIVLFSDMDLIYLDGYDKIILEEFSLHRDADAIFFSLIYTKDGEILQEVKWKNKKIYIHNSLKFGTAGLAVRSSSIRKYNLHFSELFGGGCKYCSGEDSLFIKDLLRSGGVVYSSDKFIARCARDQSTWFSGYNHKYFFDRGALNAALFPRVFWLTKFYYYFRMIGYSEIPFREMVSEINKGIKEFRTL